MIERVDNICIRLDTVPECDGRTDRQTDRQTDQKHAYTDVLKNTPITLGNAIHSMPMRDNKIGKKNITLYQIWKLYVKRFVNLL